MNFRRRTPPMAGFIWVRAVAPRKRNATLRNKAPEERRGPFGPGYPYQFFRSAKANSLPSREPQRCRPASEPSPVRGASTSTTPDGTITELDAHDREGYSERTDAAAGRWGGLTVTHTCPDCGLTLTQRLRGRSIGQGCPDCMPEKWALHTGGAR